MKNWDIEQTDTERANTISRRNTMKNHTSTYATADLDVLRKLVLDLAEVIIDDKGITADTKETNRAFTGEIPNKPEWRHEFLMKEDDTYFQAWAYTHAPNYAASVGDDSSEKFLADKGFINHPYLESDPNIVDRSLLRHGLRPPLEGEAMPPPVLGPYAPTVTIILEPIARTTSVGSLV